MTEIPRIQRNLIIFPLLGILGQKKLGQHKIGGNIRFVVLPSKLVTLASAAALPPETNVPAEV
jgi:hypothetical protein